MRRRVSVVAVVGLVAFGIPTACIRIGSTQERRLVNLNDGSMALRLRVAQEYATEQRLTKLRLLAKGRFPILTDEDLASIRLAWQRVALGDGEHVMLEITFIPASNNVDGKAVADYLARQVLEDVQARMGASAERG